MVMQSGYMKEVVLHVKFITTDSELLFSLADFHDDSNKGNVHGPANPALVCPSLFQGTGHSFISLDMFVFATAP